ncbi:ribbon-helix-helix domain-containing protein [Azospirillum sp. YIM B02556]|uniref:Ribbon-helix-helix domain-containing protein n=1 Tax=Azospirillum endophyticum TaxID=2800326 RepID=A0ABS1FG55_9PROT|nr:ribbon-helix-helix domain-containing protein [Azospirillum endophyticum]MBK1842421.1 ribbon-helix-helix domain-containing protein [Azospirillum endophyticum]
MHMRNIRVNGKRTSMKLMPVEWESLEEICVRENMTMSELVSKIEAERQDCDNLTGCVRVYALCYFRNAARLSEPMPRHRATAAVAFAAE